MRTGDWLENNGEVDVGRVGALTFLGAKQSPALTDAWDVTRS